MSRPGYAIGMVRPMSLVATLAAVASGGTFAAGSFKLRMPQTGKIIGITLNVGARGGTHSTSTIDVLKGATSLLAAVFNVQSLTPGTPVDKEGSALASAADSVAKDSTIAITIAESGGTSPTWGLATIQIDYVPLGD